MKAYVVVEEGLHFETVKGIFLEKQEAIDAIGTFLKHLDNIYLKEYDIGIIYNLKFPKEILWRE